MLLATASLDSKFVGDKNTNSEDVEAFSCIYLPPPGDLLMSKVVKT